MSGKRTRRGLLCLMLAAMTLLSACGGASGSEAMLLEPGSVERTGSHDTAAVVLGDMYRDVYEPAHAVYYRPESVVCGDLAGAKLVRILVKKDQVVQEGDVLAEFEVQYSQAELDGLYADLEIASLQYETSRQSYQAALDAAKAALAAGPVSGMERTLLELAVKRAQNEYDEYVRSGSLSLAAIYERIEEFEERIARTTVTAPCSGVVCSVKKIDVGSVVAANTVICEIADPDSRFLEARSPGGFRWGAPVFITNALVENGAEIPGHVFLAPDASGAGSATLVRADDPEMMAAIFASATSSFVTVRYTMENVLMVPSKALQREGNDIFLDVVADGVVCKRFVVIGISGRQAGTGDEVTQIVDGVSEGDLVLFG